MTTAWPKDQGCYVEEYDALSKPVLQKKLAAFGYAYTNFPKAIIVQMLVSASCSSVLNKTIAEITQKE